MKGGVITEKNRKIITARETENDSVGNNVVYTYPLYLISKPVYNTTPRGSFPPR